MLSCLSFVKKINNVYYNVPETVKFMINCETFMQHSRTHKQRCDV